jgi:hypothetical protein
MSSKKEKNITLFNEVNLKLFLLIIHIFLIEQKKIIRPEKS